MPIKLTNTLGGKKEIFEPAAPPKVGVYVCGPTVYDVAHVGHARAACVFDTLRRHLMWRGYDVFFVRNITDVDDKIIAKANELGIDSMAVAERFTRQYDDTMRALNVLPPDIAPRASGHIVEMQEMIARLIERDHAYPAGGSVYFAVKSFATYGSLSGRPVDELAARERVEASPEKRHPLDFALWKAAKPNEPSWPSPWGPGRPGWHIECSAMAARYLGMPFDIHAGGADLIFPHHENEIAQAEAATGDAPFARVWLHNGHVQISGEKMSKSLRNYVLVEEVLADYAAEVVRIFFASAHYRSQMNYAPEGLEEAAAVWERFRAFLRAAPANAEAPSEMLDDFGAAMDDDLNTPAALSALHALVADGHRSLQSGDAQAAGAARAAVKQGLEVLGCLWQADETGAATVGPLVDYLLELREQARASRDFAKADEIRDRLGAAGVVVEDSPEGPRWHAT